MKTISLNDYLKAKGLFALAREHATEAEKYHQALARLLCIGDESMGWMGDAVWNGDPSFEHALEQEDIAITSYEPVDDNEADAIALFDHVMLEGNKDD